MKSPFKMKTTLPIMTEITDPVLKAKLLAMNPRHSKDRNQLQVMDVGEIKSVTTKTKAQLKALVRRMNSDHQKRGTIGHWTVLLASETGRDGKVVRRDS
jgi:hypothetical protein